MRQKLFNLTEIARFLDVTSKSVQRKVNEGMGKFTDEQKEKLKRHLKRQVNIFIKEYLS